ncbi:phenylalanine N-monooxygenase-like [Hibiscus syriacus]|uniref:Phenylalanine N-monooxygenase-like n=1 Tax=Hibiscus syriacus TaxID=106335 RepID=A0A6A2WBQ0_HIBSY|nr:phenylalanine N-monooxygenase-like [Hibiscus syriacus]
MAVVGGVSRGGNVCLQRQEPSHLFNSHNPNVRPRSLMVSNPQSLKPRPPTRISTSKVNLQPLPKRQEKKSNAVLYHKIDEWMRDSVADIVKNLQESPLLVHVYSDDDNTTRTRTEKADELNWVSVKQRWEKGESTVPDGLIFVEQIQEEEGEGEYEKGDACCRAWGIAVQGQGRGIAPACYLLKTCRVSSGLGLKCTHFCLVKVQSFRETAFSQLKNCWLLQGNST